MLVPQFEHARAAVFVSPLMSLPLPQLVCALQEALRWDEESW